MASTSTLGRPGVEAGRVGAEPGFWIRNAQVEAFVTAEERIRVLALRLLGGENLLSSTGAVTDGLRCWVMTPTDDEDERDDLACLAGRIEPGDGRLRVTTPASAKLGLTLTWNVCVDPDEPAVTIDHVISNPGEAARVLAVWPVIGIAPGARLVLPFSQVGERAQDARVLYHYPWSTLQDSRISAGSDHIQLEIRADDAPAHIKFGVFQRSGSGAAVVGNSVLVSHTALEPGGTYPEGGPNLTVYASPAQNGQAVGELENVGALHLLEAGGSVALRQVLAVQDAADSPFLRSVRYPGAQ